MSLRISIDKTSLVGLRDQLQREISRLIVEGRIPPGARLPSSRQLAKDVNVSLNTVLGAYGRLFDNGLITSVAKSGYYVSKDLQLPLRLETGEVHLGAAPKADIASRIIHGIPLSMERRVARPINWQNYQYTFVTNQIDDNRFPIAEWRECTRQAMNRRNLREWSGDSLYRDSSEFLEQICQRILPRRGIFVPFENTLVTMGVQQALFIVSSLFHKSGSRIAMEDPGYPDARNIFGQWAADIKFIPVDEEGMLVDGWLEDVDLVYVTPNRQFPTTVSMSKRRRTALLASAEKHDFFIVEDDYECDVDYRVPPPMPLYQADLAGRVLYLGSLSKSLSPGLRLGYIVAPPEFIVEARALRGMMVRHPPVILQHTAALFISLGYYDALLLRLHKSGERKWRIADEILRRDFADLDILGQYGGTNFILSDPRELQDADELVKDALEKSIVIESAKACFAYEQQGRHRFRMGFSSVRADKIEPGLSLLRQLLR